MQEFPPIVEESMEKLSPGECAQSVSADLPSCFSEVLNLKRLQRLQQVFSGRIDQHHRERQNFEPLLLVRTSRACCLGMGVS